MLTTVAILSTVLASSAFAQMKPRFELGSPEEAAARAGCQQAIDRFEAEGKLGYGADTPEGKRSLVEGCVDMERRSDVSYADKPKPQAYIRGKTALEAGDLERAIAEFTAALAEKPDCIFCFIRRGEAYEQKGNARSAIADYSEVMRHVDDDTRAEYAAKIRKLELRR
jgi:tetratricopeptide (TPR) repeat protein